MPFHFDFSAAVILWTLTFAAGLVLLVVLFGRDRAARFPWFTASIALLCLRLLVVRLLADRVRPMVWNWTFLTLADLAAALNLAVPVEVARRAFAGARSRNWWLAFLGVTAVGVAATALWGPWPDWSTLTAGTVLADLRLLQMISQKGDFLGAVAAIELGLLVVAFGRRFKAGWRSHTQRIAIGLSVAGLSLLATLATRRIIGAHTVVHTRAQFERIMALQTKIYNANSVIYLAVLLWWIVCLWIDEPGAEKRLTAPAEPGKEIKDGAEAGASGA